MSDTKERLQRARSQFPPPESVMESLRRRRDRKHRNQRIEAGVLGLAIAIAVGWLGVNAIRSTPPVPADDPTPTPAPSEDLGIFAPVAGRIVYGNSDGIWSIDPTAPVDRDTRVQLSSDRATPLGWSSDGTKLLIRTSQSDLSILHADGSETQVSTDLRYPTATISPDGSQVVYAPGYGRRMYTVDTGGGERRILLDSSDLVYEPTFSPDGTQIAYVVGSGDHSHHVWVMDADGSDAHEIVFNESTMGASHVMGLAWSPAGDRIAIGFDVDEAIYTFAPDGSDFKRVITDGYFPYWSPDGSQIAYAISCLEDPNGCGLAIADASGSNIREFGFAASGPWHPGE